MFSSRRFAFALFFLVVFCAGSARCRKFHLVYPGWDATQQQERLYIPTVMAIEDYQAAGHLTEHEFEVFYFPGTCDEKTVIKYLLYYLIEKDIDAIIGPLCSTAAVPTSWLANYWNLTVMSDGATDSRLTDKDIYNNVIRVGPATTKLSEVILDILNYFDWTTVFLFTYVPPVIGMPHSGCSYTATALQVILRDTKFIITEWVRQDYTEMPLHVIDQYLERIRTRARIVLMCMFETEIVRVMLRAHELGMTNGDYVFIRYYYIPDNLFYWLPWTFAAPDNLTQEEMQWRKEAFYVYKQISVGGLTGPEIDEFRAEVGQRLYEWGATRTVEEMGGLAWVWNTMTYDATTLYLMILEQLLEEGLDHRYYKNFFDRAIGFQFHGKTGQVVLDHQADRKPQYVLWYYGPGMEEMTQFLDFALFKPINESATWLIPEEEVYWGTPDNKPPPAVPPCGFLGELCPPDKTNTYIIIGCTVAIFVIFAIAVTVYILYQRKMMLEQELNSMLWRINFEDISSTQKRTGSVIGLSMKSLRSMTSNTSSGHHGAKVSDAHHQEQMFTNVGYYQGKMVAIRKVDKDRIELNRTMLMDLKIVHSLAHDNLLGLVGACIDPPNIAIVTNYAPKGSLQDIVENDEVKLDWPFKFSLISDLASGINYLHGSELKSHGYLKSSCCLVDSRWTLKITSFGLYYFKLGERVAAEMGEYALYKKQLWTAPELLRMGATRPPYGSQKGDVYSFSILVQEILYRAYPYFMDVMSPKEIIDLVKKESDEPYRPNLPQKDEDVDAKMITLMKDCWAEDPEERPSFDKILKRLMVINKGKKFNIVDNMIQKLEKYASNLEEIVAHRTSELIEEKKKTDTLLYRMLPSTVADDLKQGVQVVPELYDEVTIYFSDIVGFTSLSSESTPMQVIDLLNDLYTMFDAIIDQHDVYKVETIGDAYMCVSGVPERNGDRHVGEIANMSLDLLSATITSFKVRHRPGYKMKLRIGMHTGPCASGVVGLTMPRFCLFGDTVNMASRMESNGEPLKIHMSQTARDALAKLKDYEITLRGEMEIKGKGLQATYWLKGKSGFEKPLPTMD